MSTGVLPVLIALLLLVTACGSARPEQAVSAAQDLRWERLPDPPLSPRLLGALHWTGTELLAIGGDTVPPARPPRAASIRRARSGTERRTTLRRTGGGARPTRPALPSVLGWPTAPSYVLAVNAGREPISAVVGGTTEPADRYERVQGAWLLSLG